jgi:hypothetical protein
LIAARYIIGFIVALFASSIVFLFALEAQVIAETRITLADMRDVFFLSIFVVPFALLGGLAVGLPLYAVGYDRGWFDTLLSSAATGAVAGTAFAVAVGIVMRDHPVFSTWTLAGAVAGAVAGLIWCAIVPKRQKNSSQA